MSLPVAAVTGGGSGIGAAIAIELDVAAITSSSPTST